MAALPIERTGPTRSGAGVRGAVLGLLRVVGAGLLGTNAGIHAYLWDTGYRAIPTIGVLFLLNVIGASALTLAVLAAPRRLLPLMAVLGALLELGTAGGLFLATEHSLFGFMESSKAYLYGQSVVTEIAGTVVLAVLATVAFRWQRVGSSSSWW